MKNLTILHKKNTKHFYKKFFVLILSANDMYNIFIKVKSDFTVGKDFEYDNQC